MKSIGQKALVVLFVVGSFISAKGEERYDRMDSVGMARAYIKITCESLKNPDRNKELLEFCANALIIEADRIKKEEEIKEISKCTRKLEDLAGQSWCPTQSLCVDKSINLEQFEKDIKWRQRQYFECQLKNQ